MQENNAFSNVNVMPLNVMHFLDVYLICLDQN